MGGLGGIMGGGGPMGMINQIMQMVQQMTQQKGSECARAASAPRAGRMIPPRCSSRSYSSSRKGKADPLYPRDLRWREFADDPACSRHFPRR